MSSLSGERSRWWKTVNDKLQWRLANVSTFLSSSRRASLSSSHWFLILFLPLFFLNYYEYNLLFFFSFFSDFFWFIIWLLYFWIGSTTDGVRSTEIRQRSRSSYEKWNVNDKKKRTRKPKPDGKNDQSSIDSSLRGWQRVDSFVSWRTKRQAGEPSFLNRCANSRLSDGQWLLNSGRVLKMRNGVEVATGVVRWIHFRAAQTSRSSGCRGGQ